MQLVIETVRFDCEVGEREREIIEGLIKVRNGIDSSSYFQVGEREREMD
jgi:hypothetical protein